MTHRYRSYGHYRCLHCKETLPAIITGGSAVAWYMVLSDLGLKNQMLNDKTVPKLS